MKREGGWLCLFILLILSKYLLKDAVRLIRHEIPELVFLGVQMPERDGFDVVEVESVGRGEYIFVMKSGERLQSSRTYYEQVMKWIGNPW